MDKDRVKGTIDEVVGSAKKKAGEWTGDTQLEVEGIAQQVKGKLENTWGKVKDAVHEANAESGVQHDTHVRVDIAYSTAKDERGKNA
jgi:uncharacterized protein YjbJ (UPF0337 family)